MHHSLPELSLIYFGVKINTKDRTLYRMCVCICMYVSIEVAPMVKNLSANAGDVRYTGSIPGSGRSPGGRHGNPLQYPCLGNPVDRGAWRATAHVVAKSRT